VATAAAPAVLDDARRQRRGQIYVALAALAWSSAGVLQRQLTLDTATQVAGRAAFAAVALAAYVAVVERGHVVRACRSVGLAGVGVAVCVAVASGGFIAALNQTPVARVLFMLALAPVLAAALAWLLLGEPIGRRTAVAMAVALAGVAVMVGVPSGANATGDLIAFVMALAFALGLVITRQRRDVSMAPATILSQLLLLIVFVPFATPSEISADDGFWLALLGAGQIGLGLVLLTIGARLIPAAQVGLITLLEVVLGPVWVWIALGEQPDNATLVGGAIVIAAIVIQTVGAPAAESARARREAPVPPP
jgi:drug/metabolite transporter (DMT)-like permease